VLGRSRGKGCGPAREEEFWSLNPDSVWLSTGPRRFLDVGGIPTPGTAIAPEQRRSLDRADNSPGGGNTVRNTCCLQEADTCSALWLLEREPTCRGRGQADCEEKASD
jgi:hypothetical protein